MATLADRELSMETMLAQIEQVVRRGDVNDPPAFTLILGAGASFGVIPTTCEMLGLSGRERIHIGCIPAYLYRREHGVWPASSALTSCVREYWSRVVKMNDVKCAFALENGVPQRAFVPEAYKFLFSQDRIGG